MESTTPGLDINISYPTVDECPLVSLTAPIDGFIYKSYMNVGNQFANI